MTVRPCLRVASVVSVLVAAVLGFVAAEAPSPAGHWEGTIELPGAKLAIDLDLTLAAGGAWSGDISIPQQGARNLPLGEIVVRDAAVGFAMPGVPGDPRFAGALAADGLKISGTFSQGGQSFPFALEKKPAPAAAAKSALEGFEGFVEQAIRDWEVPGLALVVVRDGQVVLSRGFGVRDLETKTPVTPETVFAIGSCTKAFTTFVMGSLVDEGKLEWDKSVRTYLPELTLNDRSASERLTPRDMVTHRSGLPRHDALWYNTTLSRAEMVSRLPYLAPNEDLRAKFQYNNMMFLTAGYLVERVTGQSWEDAVRARIFRPLGMTASNFSVEDSQKAPDFAAPHDERDHKLQKIPFRNITNVGPAGSINSNVVDLSRWMLVHLGGGKIGDRQVIRKATLAELHTPAMTAGSLPEKPEIVPVGYALGWFVDVYRGHRRVSHGGAIDGFGALVTLYPDDGVGVAVLHNRGYTGLLDALTHHATDRVLGLSAIDWNTEALAQRKIRQEAEKEAEAKKAVVRKPGTKPSHPLADYAGEYEHPGYGAARVELVGDALRFTYNNITTPLEHWHYDVFNAAKGAPDPALEDTKVQFHTNVKGNIAALSAPLEPRVEDIVFKKRPDARLSDPKFLARFLGAYELAGQTLTVGLKGRVLTLSLPGQPEYELVPDLEDEFNLKGLSGYSLKFVLDAAGKVTEISIRQPNGVFTARPKPAQ